MKKTAILAGLVAVLTIGLIYVASQADAEQVTPTKASAATSALPIVPPAPEAMKKCGTDSHCPYGKCKGGTCGACNFNSDCRGWGKCKGGMCGACDYDSDCKGFGKCSGGRCTKSPY